MNCNTCGMAPEACSCCCYLDDYRDGPTIEAKPLPVRREPTGCGWWFTGIVLGTFALGGLCGYLIAIGGGA